MYVSAKHTILCDSKERKKPTQQYLRYNKITNDARQNKAKPYKVYAETVIRFLFIFFATKSGEPEMFYNRLHSFSGELIIQIQYKIRREIRKRRTNLHKRMQVEQTTYGHSYVAQSCRVFILFFIIFLLFFSTILLFPAFLLCSYLLSFFSEDIRKNFMLCIARQEIVV